jgi:sugar phosphate isomerase/epimerase
MNIGGHDIGVCSWSLKPKDTADLISSVQQLGLSHIQLALGPLVGLDDKRKHHAFGLLRAAGLTITAGMISFPGENYGTIATIRQTGGYVPDEHWAQRKAMSKAAGQIAQELGIARLSTHVGFIPKSSEPHYGTMVERVCEVADPLNAAGIELLMETGQETGPELLQFLNDLKCRNVRANFDPANMILYGAGDPIEAVRTLGRHIGHVHIKDATLSQRPGQDWGAEVPFGQGDVPVKEFFQALEDVGYTGALTIEREAGQNRMQDVRTAIETIRANMPAK